MKKALFVDKAPASANMLLQVQNLEDFAMMKSVTLQFLQSNADYVGGVPIPQRQRRGGGPQRDPNAMEVDALTRKGPGKGKGKKGGRGKGKGKEDDGINLRAAWIRDAECWICGKKGHLQEDCWHNTKGKASTKDKKGKGRGAGARHVNELLGQEDSWGSHSLRREDNTTSSDTAGPGVRQLTYAVEE